MNIRSAKFVKGVVHEDDILEDGKPQIAFIGRSNVGKSSIINTLVKQPDLARTSSFPGRTQEINLFLINNSFYLVDLPGYGYARLSREGQIRVQRLIYWYLLDSPYKQKKVILIIDADVGVTDNDSKMLYSLEDQEKDVVIVANKIDKIKKGVYSRQMQKIQEKVGKHKIIPFSAEKRIGVKELLAELFDK